MLMFYIRYLILSSKEDDIIRKKISGFLFLKVEKMNIVETKISIFNLYGFLIFERILLEHASSFKLLRCRIFSRNVISMNYFCMSNKYLTACRRRKERDYETDIENLARPKIDYG